LNREFISDKLIQGSNHCRQNMMNHSRKINALQLLEC